MDNLCNYSSTEEQIICVESLGKVKNAELLFATSQGMLKKVEGQEFDVAKRTIAATKLQEGDKLLSVTVLADTAQLVLRTHQGYFLRFPLEEVPVKKKNAVGVRGIRLSQKDAVEEVYCMAEVEDKVTTYRKKKYI